MHKNVFTLPVSFTCSYTEDKPNFPQQNNLILQKKGVWRGQGCEFEGLFKTTGKSQDLFKIVRAM